MLTKSDLASWRQCPRILWLEHNRPDLIPQNDPTLWRRANDGNIVGAKARELLGPNVIWRQGATSPAAAAMAAGRLRELADRHPQYRDPVAQYIARIVDLHPIVRDNYYHPAMRGSFSIKAVLPTIAQGE